MAKEKCEIPKSEKTETKRTERNVCIIGNSMAKHITNPGISMIYTEHVKTQPWATTDNIIGYILSQLSLKD